MSLAQNAKNYSLLQQAIISAKPLKKIFPTKPFEIHLNITTQFQISYIGLFFLVLAELRSRLLISNTTPPTPATS